MAEAKTYKTVNEQGETIGEYKTKAQAVAAFEADNTQVTKAVLSPAGRVIHGEFKPAAKPEKAPREPRQTNRGGKCPEHKVLLETVFPLPEDGSTGTRKCPECDFTRTYFIMDLARFALGMDWATEYVVTFGGGVGVARAILAAKEEGMSDEQIVDTFNKAVYADQIKAEKAAAREAAEKEAREAREAAKAARKAEREAEAQRQKDEREAEKAAKATAKAEGEGTVSAEGTVS